MSGPRPAFQPLGRSAAPSAGDPGRDSPNIGENDYLGLSGAPLAFRRAYCDNLLDWDRVNAAGTYRTYAINGAAARGGRSRIGLGDDGGTLNRVPYPGLSLAFRHLGHLG